MADPTEPLTDKKFSLRVSIHCEACKKKVMKVLESVEGVQKVDVDSKLQKVVVFGNVHPEIAIKKLSKSRKNAELWPEPVIVDDPKKKKTEKSKKKDKEVDPEEEGAFKNGPETQKEAVKVEDSARSGESSSSPAKVSEGSGEGQAAESKSQGKKPETGSASSQSPAAVDKKDGEMKTDGGAEGSGGGNSNSNGNGNGGKKKKNKGQENGVEGEPSSAGAPAGKISATPSNHYTGPHPVDLTPPPHHAYQYPRYYYEPPPPPHFHPPPPTYVGNYHTAYPTSSHTTTHYPINSYTASYYAAPPPQADSYAHRYPGMGPEMPPSDPRSYPRQPLDSSFEYFSDENPNGCSIM
ncbi:hypothetical protein NMG60_11032206 [Bertholletia excelsa]